MAWSWLTRTEISLEPPAGDIDGFEVKTSEVVLDSAVSVPAPKEQPKVILPKDILDLAVKKNGDEISKAVSDIVEKRDRRTKEEIERAMQIRWTSIFAG